MKELRRAIKQVMAPLQRQISNMLVRGVISVVNDAGGLQLIQGTLTADEVQEDMERVQQWGFSSVPIPGAEFIACFIGGNRDHPVILGVDSREHRPKAGLPGDVLMYSVLGNIVTTSGDGTVLLLGIAGNSIALLPTGEIVITCGGAVITLGADGVFRNTGTGPLRLESEEIELHATTSMKLDAGGSGFHITPGGYVAFGVPVPQPASPPEIP